MGTLMIRCPETGREISTGYQAEAESFHHSPVFFARSFCPACRTEHEWFAREAWVSVPERRSMAKRVPALI